MKKFVILTMVFVLFFSAIIINSASAEIRKVNNNVIHDGQILLELHSFDASSSLGFFNILINPGSQSMNASGVVLNFATSSIIIKGIFTGNSFPTFFLENNFDNSLGQLKLSGMKPYPGVATTSILGQVFFEKISDASSTISVLKDESMVLANNGFATNVLASTSNLKL